LNYTALIPVKSLSEVKSRLAPYCTPEQRANLVLHMLNHVIMTLQESQLFSRISVVSPDAHVREITQQWGAVALKEELAGHNPALTAAAHQEIMAGSQALLTISADLPLLQTRDLQGLVEQSQRYQVVLAPSQEGTGTNAILVRPPLALPYVFGLNSLQHYQHEASRQNLSHTLHKTLGLAVDIDTIDDIEMLQDVEISQHYTHTSKISAIV
jgi:2-phospho-L-lactate guanylyltransferase